MIKNILISIFGAVFLILSPSYALAATLGFSPSTGTFNRGCEFVLNIVLNTEGAQTDGTDAYFSFDSSRFTAIGIDTQNKLYSDYPGNVIDNNEGIVKVSGIAPFGKPVTGNGSLATVTFAVKEAAATGATQMTFDFDPNDKTKTSDSSVVQTNVSEDVLNSVTNGSYTVGTGTCTAAGSGSGGGTKGGGQGGVGDATPSADDIPLKTLPPAGTETLTITLTIVGSVLTVLGILGLALL